MLHENITVTFELYEFYRILQFCLVIESLKYFKVIRKNIIKGLKKYDKKSEENLISSFKQIYSENELCHTKSFKQTSTFQNLNHFHYISHSNHRYHTHTPPERTGCPQWVVIICRCQPIQPAAKLKIMMSFAKRDGVQFICSKTVSSTSR